MILLPLGQIFFMLLTVEYTVTAIVCLISAVVIQRIFVKERRRGNTASAIQGIKWFGLAIFAWGLGATLNFLLVSVIGMPATSKWVIYLGVFISLANSLFILLSLPSIEHKQEYALIVRLVQRFKTKEFIGLFCGVLGMISFVFIAASYTNTAISNNFIWLIDIPISIMVAFALLYELNKAFAGRQMKFMYLPTFALFGLIIIAVSHRIIPQDRALQVIDQEFWGLVGSITGISFKFLFILLFSILLYSWKFLSEKEEQQSLSENLRNKNNSLLALNENLQLAVESHLDTIKHLKIEVAGLQESSKVDLSDRQREVLANLAYFGENKSYTDIAQAMNISPDGFQTHIHQIKKLLNISGVGGKEQLIAFAKANDYLKYTTLKDNA